jgi:hypothetical protein
MAFNRTQRTFENVETKEVFALYMHSETHEYKLISDGSEKHAAGTEVNGFYIAPHTSVTLKINGTKQVYVGNGQFYNIKEGETITHKKYIGFKKFTKA